MNEMNEMPVSPEAPKKNNKIFIWIGVALLLCCCCVVGIFVMYQYLGDPLMKALGF
jgi:hypothetical protein